VSPPLQGNLAIRTHDGTLVISTSPPVWCGNPGIELERVTKIEAGDHASVSRPAGGRRADGDQKTINLDHAD
jgi:hypothetical protein